MTPIEKWNAVARRQRATRLREARIKPPVVVKAPKIRAPRKNKPSALALEIESITREGYLSIPDVAKLFGVERTGITHAIDAGKIPFRLIRRFRFILPAEYVAYRKRSHPVGNAKPMKGLDAYQN